MNSIRWLVLDNLAHDWPYATNICDRDKAYMEYLRCVEAGLIRDGKITDEGRVALLIPRKRRSNELRRP